MNIIRIPQERLRVIWDRRSPARAYCERCGREQRRKLFRMTARRYITRVDFARCTYCGGATCVVIRRNGK